jgi:2-hydroxychromene-2-carboxylate isomerase
MSGSIDFWYEFASTYSYPAAMRIEAAAQARDISVTWRPFLLGPIFGDQGLMDSPFNIYPAKGRYMWRDLERICENLGLGFQRPDPFPQNGLLGARVATALEGPARAKFSRALYDAEFARGLSIADPAVIAQALHNAGEDADAVFARADSDVVKSRLRAETDTARKAGIFGAPTLVTGDGELFWGNDRLDEALEWAAATAPGK